MKSLGATLFVLGLGSIILNLFGIEFIVLMWVDLWGATVGWIIRGAMTVVGLVLWGMAAMQEADLAEIPPREP